MKSMAVKIIAVVMVVAILAGTFTIALATVGVSRDKNEKEADEIEKEKGISFSYVYLKEETEVTVFGEYKNATEASKEAFKLLEIAYEGIESNIAKSINNINSSEKGSWQLFINDEETDAPANSIFVSDGGKIEWRFVEK